MKKNILLFISVFLFSVTNSFAEEIKIGLLLALTGPFADIGDDCKRGIDLAVDSKTDKLNVDNYKISLIYGDSQADPKTGISEFKRLVDQEKAIAVLTMRSTIGMSLNPLSQSKKIPVVGAVGHPKFTTNNEYAFQFWPATNQEGEVLAKKAIELNYKNIALVTAEDDWTLSLSEEFKNSFEKAGGKVSFNETVLPTEVDFLPIITRLKQKKADAIFIDMAPISSIALIAKRIREQGIKLPILANFWLGDKNAIANAGAQNVEGVIFPEVKLKYSGFEERLNKLTSSPKRPSGMTHSCYSGMAYLIEALKNNKGIKDNISYYSALNNTSQVKLLDNTIEVNNRRANFPVIIKTIKNGQVIE